MEVPPRFCGRVGKKKEKEEEETEQRQREENSDEVRRTERRAPVGQTVGNISVLGLTLAQSTAS